MSRFLRIVLPALVIVVWLAIASVGGPYFGKISEVSTNDQTSFLPASADATKVQERSSEFRQESGAPAIIVLERDGGMSSSDLTAAKGLATQLGDRDDVEAVSPVIPSEDGDAVEIVATLTTAADTGDAVEAIRADVDDALPAGISGYVTGPAGFTADLTEAFAGIDGLLLGVALAAVFVILIIVYRSPLLPILVLGTATFALCASILVVWWLAKADIVTVNGQVQGILSILVIGAATDYALLYTARFREALRDHRTGWGATKAALRGSLEPILASGGTVIVGVLCLLLSDLNSNKALGPVAAIGIAFSLLAALSLLPALLLAFRRAAFWPLRPAYGSAHPVLTGPDARGIWARVGRLVAKRSRVVWIVCTVGLLAMGTGLVGLKADGVPQSDLVIGASQARDGQDVLADHFPGGSGSPAQVIGSERDLDALVDAVTGVDGVDGVVAAAKDAPSGTVPVTGDSTSSGGAAAPTVSRGDVLLEATLSDPADSDAAEQTVRDLRTAVERVDPGAVVGGVTATAVDTNDTGIRDRTLIIPVVLVVILLILMLLLRSVVAPLVLIGSVIVSFAAALGVGALVFDHVFHFPGADPSVPLYSFVFLVALGVDYNIFLMTRVREEALRHGPHEGVLRGLGVTGGVITSAGVVLAATFAALGVIPILFLVQIAFVVAFGVLLDTIVVRSLLVPAIAYDLGRRAWWPSRLSRANHHM
ncbi:RND superfamily putative drug exporter [Curtobacterium sp. PhB172]|uniref:MMPL family transporter n=1 Tax=unclassified Curtobacterium TaxID=257496 RepID=UPI000F49B678|nr:MULTISPECIES: efflux RND transporter permease subunit [unclassified Curtobacterium]ROQ16797.1 RND superfamily putative drug exporter [Curtobacterium sp. PhB171]ROQ25126.1 RND superfamily putative drug exporter [Curtobacterium sp. PhB170]ROS36577.1 RND superfamily putative drug exporter [Curtobacterium sp. PhB131]ROS70249.1 RND superfamily putative drug exporter [Curtobacterium sp. PhB172]ROS71255.1 RND superfamily putative drug exporter [Curtobacterium sp. PhB141]